MHSGGWRSDEGRAQILWAMRRATDVISAIRPALLTIVADLDAATWLEFPRAGAERTVQGQLDRAAAAMRRSAMLLLSSDLLRRTPVSVRPRLDVIDDEEAGSENERVNISAFANALQYFTRSCELYAIEYARTLDLNSASNPEIGRRAGMERLIERQLAMTIQELEKMRWLGSPGDAVATLGDRLPGGRTVTP